MITFPFLPPPSFPPSILPSSGSLRLYYIYITFSNCDRLRNAIRIALFRPTKIPVFYKNIDRQILIGKIDDIFFLSIKKRIFAYQRKQFLCDRIPKSRCTEVFKSFVRFLYISKSMCYYTRILSHKCTTV